MGMVLRCARTLALGCAVAGITGGTAAAQEPPNGDFEDGVVDPWNAEGDAGVTTDNVLKGDFSGFLTTGENAVGEVCSTLESEFVFPSTDKARVEVAFKVRYKTNEFTGPFENFEDPFHAELRTVKGTVDLLTIKTDGLFWTKGDPTNTKVRIGGKRLRQPPAIPPFEENGGTIEEVAFQAETPPISVSSKLDLKGCEPVSIKFQICDWEDDAVDSAAVVDEVKIKFKEDGDQCTIDMIDDSTMDAVEGLSSAPRE